MIHQTVICKRNSSLGWWRCVLCTCFKCKSTEVFSSKKRCACHWLNLHVSVRNVGFCNTSEALYMPSSHITGPLGLDKRSKKRSRCVQSENANVVNGTSRCPRMCILKPCLLWRPFNKKLLFSHAAQCFRPFFPLLALLRHEMDSSSARVDC